MLRRVPASGIEEVLIERLRCWTHRPDAGRTDLLPFVRRVELYRDAMAVELSPPPHEKWAAEAPEQCSALPNGIRMISPVKIMIRGGRTSRIDGTSTSVRARPDKALMAGLRRAHAELRARGVDLAQTRSSVQDARGVDDPYLRKLTGLAFLAPDIQRAILEGRQPAGLKLADLVSRELPLAWNEQRKLVGMA